MLEVLLSECHPEAGTLDSRIIDDKALNLLMVKQIAVTRSNVGIGEVFMNLQWLRLYPLAVLPVESFLGDFADVDFRVEVGGESLVVIAGIAVDNV